MKLAVSQWKLTVSRNMSFWQACLDVSGHYRYSKFYGLKSLKHLAITHNACHTYLFTDEVSHVKYLKYLEKTLVSPGYLKKLEKYYLDYGSRLQMASDRLEKQATLKNYQDFILAENILCAGLFLTTAIGRHIFTLLDKELHEYYLDLSPASLNILISELTYPDKHSPLAESQISLLKIGSLLQKKKIAIEDLHSQTYIYKELQKYIRKYSYIPVNFSEDPWTEKEVLAQLKQLLKDDCLLEINKLSKIHKQQLNLSRAKLKGIKSKRIIKLVEVLKLGTYLNEYRKFIFCRASVAYRPLFKQIAKEYKLSSWKECWKLSPHEIENLYFRKDKKVLDLLKKRTWTGVVWANNKGSYQVLNPEDIKEFIDKASDNGFKKKNKNIVQQLTGSIANKGKVIARARVILSSKDFYKFKDGDVIVTSMTSVDFVPLMRRAGAFVTNEGGITSHAAVVSREMNKPCIIGTKIATQVFKDNDLVEVDAHKGIVKILKKNNYSPR